MWSMPGDSEHNLINKMKEEKNSLQFVGEGREGKALRKARFTIMEVDEGIMHTRQKRINEISQSMRTT